MTGPQGRLVLTPDGEWRQHAACRPAEGATDEERRRNVAIFFPADGDYRQAASICEVCPVLAECAVYVDEVDASHGWWAGAQRDAIRGDSGLRRRLGCGRCGGPLGTSGLRRPGKRWCSLECFRLDQAGLPLLHTAPNGDPRPQVVEP